MNIPIFSITTAIFYFGWLWQTRSGPEQRGSPVAPKVQVQKPRRQAAQGRAPAANRRSSVRHASS